MSSRVGSSIVVLALVQVLGCGGAKAVGPRAPATVALSPANPVAVSRMVQGVQAAKDGQRDRAVMFLREAIQLDPNLWEARYDLGVVLANAGDLAGAEEPLAYAANLASGQQEVAVALAEVRRRRGETKLAADGLADFVRDHPNAVDARTFYLASLEESGQIGKAIAEAREVLVRRPADATALAELALSHLARGEKDAASLLAKEALDANPSSAVAHRATGLLDLANGDDAEAFAEFRKASQADSHDTTSRLNMGVVLLRAGVYAKAEEQYREILTVSPDDVEAQRGLAAALRGQGDAEHPQKFDEARVLLEKVLATNPHDASALFNLGLLYADFLRKPVEGAPLFKRFLAEVPSDHPLRGEAEKHISAATAGAAPASSTIASPLAPPRGSLPAQK